MNSFTNTILSLLLGWLRTLLNVARDFISSDSSTAFFDFFRNNWRILFLVLCLGGFALDKIVYLIRWRPSPIWIRRRERRQRLNPPPLREAYPIPDFDSDAPVFPPEDYGPYEDEPYPEAAPTMQYQIQSRQPERQAFDPAPTYPAYAAPQYAPDSRQNDDLGYTAPLHWDEASQGHTFAPADDRQQRFAFGMAPSFGSAQSEPAYSYHREAIPTFSPPLAAQPDPYPVEPYPPQPVYDGFEEEPDYAQPNAYPESTPFFRPFSDRGAEPAPPPKPTRFGAVARRARDLLNADEAYESLTYQDLQPTVDVTKAFHSPVYPEKKSEGDS